MLRKEERASCNQWQQKSNMQAQLLKKEKSFTSALLKIMADFALKSCSQPSQGESMF